MQLTVPQRRRAGSATLGYTGPHAEALEWASSRGSEDKMWARGFTMVSTGKVKQGRVRRFRIGQV